MNIKATHRDRCVRKTISGSPYKAWTAVSNPQSLDCIYSLSEMCFIRSGTILSSQFESFINGLYMTNTASRFKNHHIQYNTTDLWYRPSSIVHAKLRSALSRLSGADAIAMQSIVGEELAMWRLKRDSNPLHFGRKATNLPMSHHASLLRYPTSHIHV